MVPPLAEGCFSTMNGEGGGYSGEILATAVRGGVWPRMQYGRQEKPSDVEETFGTSCQPLNLFAVRSVFDLQKQTM